MHAGGAAKATIGQLAISGYLFAHDFPDVVDEIRARCAAPAGSTLGMSYEIAAVEVPNREALIWTATAFTFTGAAVLRRDRPPIHDPGSRWELATSNQHSATPSAVGAK